MSKRADGFLSEMIDYAGTFPPAKLPHSDAVAEYFALVGSMHVWILNNLAWSVTDLGILADLLGNRRVAVSAIGRPGSSWEEWQTAREKDAKDLSVFLGCCPHAVIATYECIAPPLEHLEAGLASLKSFERETSVFFELPHGSDFQTYLGAFAEEEWPNAKLRCGGAAIPAPTELAQFLAECVDLEVPFKLTAGLHEPVAHHGHHGFLNVSAAVGMRFHDDASIGEMAAVLQDEESAAFSLDETFQYRGRSFSSEEMEDVRSFFLSFGSCSVLEPISGLDRITP